MLSSDIFKVLPGLASVLYKALHKGLRPLAWLFCIQPPHSCTLLSWASVATEKRTGNPIINTELCVVVLGCSLGSGPWFIEVWYTDLIKRQPLP